MQNSACQQVFDEKKPGIECWKTGLRMAGRILTSAILMPNYRGIQLIRRMDVAAGFVIFIDGHKSFADGSMLVYETALLMGCDLKSRPIKAGSLLAR